MTNELKSLLKGFAWCVLISFAIYGVTMAIYFA